MMPALLVFRVYVVTVLLCCGLASAATEPRTGIKFSDKLHKKPLSKLGVRTKGPFKVYAVGQYGNDLFLLKMSMGVGAQKMSSALIDALKPRCKGCGSNDIAEFEALLLSGLPNGASKGTQLLFGTARGKLTVTINDKQIGTISSKQLAQAFVGIYTDKQAVCQLKSVDDTIEEGIEHETFEPILVAVGAIAVTMFLL